MPIGPSFLTFLLLSHPRDGLLTTSLVFGVLILTSYPAPQFYYPGNPSPLATKTNISPTQHRDTLQEKTKATSATQTSHQNSPLALRVKENMTPGKQDTA
jgi:hypothetical protein